MKNKLQNFSVITLTVIYCLAISMVVTSRIDSRIQQHSHLKKDSFASVVSSPIYFLNTATTECAISILSNDLPSGFKNQTSKAYLAAASVRDHLAKSQFYQYKNNAINFLVQHRKADNLFPFQYFW